MSLLLKKVLQKLKNIETKITKLEEKTEILYSNASGTASDFTLNKSKDEFEYIEVFYRNNDKNLHSAKLKVVNGTQNLSLFTINSNGENRTYIKYAVIVIDGRNVYFNADNYKQNGETTLVSGNTIPTPSSSNIIFILEVREIK